MALQLLRWIGISRHPTFAPTTTHIRTFALSQTSFRLSLDPAIRRQQMDRQNETRREKRRTDAEYVARLHQRDRERPPHKLWGNKNRQLSLQAKRVAHQRRKAEDPVYTLQRCVRDTATKCAWARESLPWKTHIPVLYDEKVEHTCGKCVVSRYGGLKLWWRERDDETKFLCHKCYFTGPEAMPEGYEDCTTLTEMKTRKRELGH